MLVILDKDGTLTESASGNTFVQSPTDQQLLPGVAERIVELNAKGVRLVIASNQGGVASGHKTLKQAAEEMKFCLTLLPEIDSAFFCPDFDGKLCYSIGKKSFRLILHNDAAYSTLRGTYRKPKPGMLHLAIDCLGESKKDAVMIGDRPEDAQAAVSAGITFVDAEAWRTGAVEIITRRVISE
jgi:D-glycero-D-manno-heptose 1,7-bisphosphate phosphatase